MNGPLLAVCGRTYDCYGQIMQKSNDFGPPVPFFYVPDLLLQIFTLLTLHNFYVTDFYVTSHIFTLHVLWRFIFCYVTYFYVTDLTRYICFTLQICHVTDFLRYRFRTSHLLRYRFFTLHNFTLQNYYVADFLRYRFSRHRSCTFQIVYVTDVLLHSFFTLHIFTLQNCCVT
jgi:hypothetical protein